MSEPSNGAWPFQEIPEEEGLDISAIFGDSSAAPQGDPFAPPAAAQSVPSSPTPVAQEITPAVAATSQPTTAPIAKAPVEAPAENPIAAAFEQKTAENTKKGLLEKPPVRRGSSAIRLFIRARNSSTSTAATESIPDRSCAACEETEERSANLLAAFIQKC